jgi:ABC-type transport system substrate-binding protein
MLGFDIGLVAGQGTNPLADECMRRAIGHAIDIAALRMKMMGGAAIPAGLLWGPGVFGYRPEENRRPVRNPTGPAPCWPKLLCPAVSRSAATVRRAAS